MKIVLFLFFIFSTFIVGAQDIDLYYKTIKSTEAKDSILDKLRSDTIEFVEFSKPCYWETRDSLDIDYCNSSLIVYQDSNEIYQTILVTEFFIYREENEKNDVYKYFQANKTELLQTHLRPDERDLVRRTIDKRIIRDLKYEVGDTLSYTDSLNLMAIGPGYEHYNRGTDGLPNQSITISTKDTSNRINIDKYLFFSDNYYYRFNCKKPIYTLKLLLEKEFEMMKISVEHHLQNKELGLLNSIGQLDFKSNPKNFEKVYEEQIGYWMKLMNNQFGKNWTLRKNEKKNSKKDKR